MTEHIINEKRLNEFLEYIIERMNIFHKKEASTQRPYTSDKVLQKYKFCNVYRELDAGSIDEYNSIKNLPTFKEKIKYVCLYRHSIKKHVTDFLMTNPTEKEFTKYANKFKGNKLISDAIQFFPFTGYNRISFLYFHYKNVQKNIDKLCSFILTATTGESIFKKIQELFPGIGPFRAYEMFTSLTYLKEFKWEEEDIHIVGPGSIGSLEYLFDKKLTQKEMKKMLYDYAFVIKNKLKEKGFKFMNGLKYTDYKTIDKFTTRTFEDCLCEFRKYKNLSNGKGRSRIYDKKIN